MHGELSGGRRTAAVSLLAAVFLAVPVVSGQDAFFGFDSGSLPESCALGTGRYMEPGVRTMLFDAEPRSGDNIALQKDGSHLRLELDAMDKDPLTGALPEFTVALWFRRADLAENFILFTRNPVGKNHVRRPGFLRISGLTSEGDEACRIRFDTVFAGGEFASAKTSPLIMPPGEWHHFACVFQQGNLAIYLNGEPIGNHWTFQFPEIAALEDRQGGFSVGLHLTGIDDLGLFPRALEAEELFSLQQEGKKHLKTP